MVRLHMSWLHSDWKLIFALELTSLIELTSTPLLTGITALEAAVWLTHPPIYWLPSFLEWPNAGL